MGPAAAADPVELNTHRDALKKPKSNLEREDWDFKPVDADDVPYCLLYEMARESAAVEKLVRRWRSWWQQARAWNEKHGKQDKRGEWIVPDGRGFDPTGEKQRPLHRAAAKFIPKINFSFRRDALPALIATFGSQEHDAKPWLLLNDDARAKVKRGVLGPPAVWTGYGFDVQKLHDAGRAGKLRPALGEVMEQASCFDDSGRELVLLVIDWPGFNDKAVENGLDRWWKAKDKPIRENAPVRVGKGFDYARLREQLDNLGYARLRASYTPTQVFEAARPAWEKLAGKHGFTNTALTRFGEAIKGRSDSFWKYFKEAFDFDDEMPKSRREFEKRGPRRAALIVGE